MLAAKPSFVISVVPVLLLAILSSPLPPNLLLVSAAVTPQTRSSEPSYSDQLQRPPVFPSRDTAMPPPPIMSENAGQSTVTTSHKQNIDDSSSRVNVNLISDKGNGGGGGGGTSGIVNSNSERGYHENTLSNSDIVSRERRENFQSVMITKGGDKIPIRYGGVNFQIDPNGSDTGKVSKGHSDNNKINNNNDNSIRDDDDDDNRKSLKVASMSENHSSPPQMNGLLKTQNVAGSDDVSSFHQRTLNNSAHSQSFSDNSNSSSSSSSNSSKNSSRENYPLDREKREARGSGRSDSNRGSRNSRNGNDAPKGYNREPSSEKTKSRSELPRDETKLTGYWEKRNQEYANRTKADKAKSHGPRTNIYSEDIQVGCTELRARRYITDGFCTSEKAIKEVVCAGHCLPIKDMPWYAEFVKTISRRKLRDWQCVEDSVRRKKVKLLCQNQEYRYYRIKVVKSCKCKKLTSHHNRTRRNRRKRRRKGGKKKKKKQPKAS